MREGLQIEAMVNKTDVANEAIAASGKFMDEVYLSMMPTKGRLAEPDPQDLIRLSRVSRGDQAKMDKLDPLNIDSCGTVIIDPGMGPIRQKDLGLPEFFDKIFDPAAPRGINGNDLHFPGIGGWTRPANRCSPEV